MPRITIPLHVRWALITFIALPVIGTLGYWLLEPQYTLFDALYMTAITLTTVGYGEIHPLSATGRVFTIFLLLGGALLFSFTANEVIRSIIAGEMKLKMNTEEPLETRLARMQDHIVVIGLGRMGRRTCQELSAQQVSHVAVDRALPDDYKSVDCGLALKGDATQDEVLKRAGITRAKKLVLAIKDSAESLYVVMSARFLNAELFIVARSENDDDEKKLRRAGANYVITPSALGGHQIAQILVPAQAHRHRHTELHDALEELFADYATVTGRNATDSISTLRDWSFRQTREPDDGVSLMAQFMEDK